MIICKLCGNELTKQNKDLDQYDQPLYYMETIKGIQYDICTSCSFDDEILYKKGSYADDNQPKPTAADRDSFLAGIAKFN